jgi:hypothetical protein
MLVDVCTPDVCLHRTWHKKRSSYQDLLFISCKIILDACQSFTHDNRSLQAAKYLPDSDGNHSLNSGFFTGIKKDNGKPWFKIETREMFSHHYKKRGLIMTTVNSCIIHILYLPISPFSLMSILCPTLNTRPFQGTQHSAFVSSSRSPLEIILLSKLY